MHEPGVPDRAFPAPPAGITAAPARPAAVTPEPRRPAPHAAGVVRPTGGRHLVLAAVWSVAALTYVQRQAFSGGGNEIMRAFGLGDQGMGYFWAAFLIAYGLFQVPFGLLSDRWGARHLLSALVLGWSVTMAALALVPPLP